MVYCSAREDLGAAPGDPKDLYIATFGTHKSNLAGETER